MTTATQDKQVPAPIAAKSGALDIWRDQSPEEFTKLLPTAEAQTSWRVLTKTLYPAAKNAETVLQVVRLCAARKLDPLSKPYHIVSYKDSDGNSVDNILPGIALYLTIAHRTGQFAGKDAPIYGPIVDVKFKQKSMKVPEWCSVTVYKKVDGVKEPFTETIYFEEFVQLKYGDPNSMWLKMPRSQMSKCAKAMALRTAFPEELGSDPTFEEMEDSVLSDERPAIAKSKEAAQEKAQAERDSIVASKTARGEDVTDVESKPVDPTFSQKLEAQAETLAAQGRTDDANSVYELAKEHRGLTNDQLKALRDAGQIAGVAPAVWIAEAKNRFALDGKTWSKDISATQYEELLAWLAGQKKS